MDAREDRKTMAGMLQRAVAAARGHSGKECPGPDLLAAYYERALSPAERQHWEAHFSTCGFCQAQLAALTRSEPQPQPQPFWSWRWHWAWKWLPPAAVALSAIAIWIAMHPNNPVRELEKRPLQVATTRPVAPNPQEELKGAVRGESPAPAEPESTSKARTSSATVEKQQARAAKPGGVHSESAATERSKEMARGAMARTGPRIVVKKTEMPPSVTDNAAPAGQAVAPVEDKPTQGRTRVGVVEEAAPMAPAPSPSPPAKGESSSGKTRPGYATGAASGGFGAAGQSVLEVRSAEVVIASPDPEVRWRIGVGGTIERTTDGGKTWQGQFVNVKPVLVAGSAPSVKVCWVVGRAGTILRTKDGENWERIAPPAMIDFTGIKAKDEKMASVIVADGRSFSTQDGGKTWQVVQQDH